MVGQNKLRTIPIDSVTTWLHVLRYSSKGTFVWTWSAGSFWWMCGKTEPSNLAKSVLLNRWYILLSAVSSIPGAGRQGGVRRRAFWEHIFGLSLISITWSPTNWQFLFSDAAGEMNTSNSCLLWTGPSSRLPFLCQYCPLGGWHLRGAQNTLSLIASTSPGRNRLNRKIINAEEWQCWWSPQTQVSERVSKAVLPHSTGAASWDKGRLLAQNPYLQAKESGLQGDAVKGSLLYWEEVLDWRVVNERGLEIIRVGSLLSF